MVKQLPSWVPDWSYSSLRIPLARGDREQLYCVSKTTDRLGFTINPDGNSCTFEEDYLTLSQRRPKRAGIMVKGTPRSTRLCLFLFYNSTSLQAISSSIRQKRRCQTSFARP